MIVRVHGKHMQVGSELRELAERKVDHAGRAFADGSTADVEFAEQRNPRLVDEKYRVEITSLVAGQTVRVEATGPDERAAVDQAADKFERLLRRMKERLIDRTRRNRKQPLNEQEQTAEEHGEPDSPDIVRVKKFAMKAMLPQEAALQMDMLDHSFFFFLNGETDRFSVLYRRRDGTLGLIEPA